MWQSGKDPRGEKTEWADILVKHGIIQPTYHPSDDEEEEVEHISPRTEKQMKMESMTLDQLNAIEDDVEEGDEEDFFESYRRQRMAELRNLQKRNIYGSVEWITQDEYKKEVTEAPSGIWVVCTLFKEGLVDSELLLQQMNIVSRKFPYVKFVRIVSTDCIPGYPDRNVPTVLVYKDGELMKQLVGPLEFGGALMSPDSVEWTLAQIGAVETELESNPLSDNRIRIERR